MKMPFTTEQFFEVFRSYNEATTYALPVLYTLAIAAYLLSIYRVRFSDRIISFVLAILWIWMGVVYHIIFFAAINKAAYIFGTLFIAQGILFFIWGVAMSRLSFRLRPGIYSITSTTLICFALIVYPLIGVMIGHRYPSSPTFGLPCPTAIFTFGMLLITDSKRTLWILAIPLLWSAIGFTAAIILGVYEDIALLVAGLLSFSLLLYRSRAERIVIKPGVKNLHVLRSSAIQDMSHEEL